MPKIKMGIDSLKLMGIKGNWLYSTICGCLPYFSNVRVVGHLIDYINWEK